MTSVVTASAAPLAGIEEEDNNGGFNLEDGSEEAIFNGTSIHYSRSATIFAAVAASIFTFVGITGKSSERHFYSRKKSNLFFIAYITFSCIWIIWDGKRYKNSKNLMI